MTGPPHWPPQGTSRLPIRRSLAHAGRAKLPLSLSESSVSSNVSTASCVSIVLKMTSCSTLADVHNSDPLIRFSNYYTLPSSVLGLLCNAVALWCVVGCPKTHTTVKVLLYALFSTILLECLTGKFLTIYILWCCDDMTVPYVDVGIGIPLSLLTAVEDSYILIITFFRTVAQWFPQRHGVKIQTSVGLVVGVPLYNIAFPAVLIYIAHLTMITQGKVIWALQFFLPVALTLACYASLILVARRNKRRLAATQDTATTDQVMDQDTRAMLAVFITNLVLVMPRVTGAFLHLFNVSNKSFTVITGILLKTHVFVAPVVFVCFNNHHQQRVLQAVKSCLLWVSRCPPCTRPHTTNTFPFYIF